MRGFWFCAIWPFEQLLYLSGSRDQCSFIRSSAGVGAGWVLRNSYVVHSALYLSLGVIRRPVISFRRFWYFAFLCLYVNLYCTCTFRVKDVTHRRYMYCMCPVHAFHIVGASVSRTYLGLAARQTNHSRTSILVPPAMAEHASNQSGQ